MICRHAVYSYLDHIPVLTPLQLSPLRLPTDSLIYVFLPRSAILIVRILSSTLLPGFNGPESPVLFRLRRSTFYTLLRSAFAYSVRFYDTLGNNR